MAIGSDFTMKYKIVADAAKAKAEIRDVDDLLKGFGRSAGSAFASLGTAGSIAGAGILAIGAAAVSTGVSLFNLTKAASDFGSEIFDASKKTGLQAEALSAMKFAADQSGSSMEQVTAGIAKFAKTVGAANEDTKKGAKFLHDFGVTPQEAIKDLDGALDKVFKKIISAPEGIQRMTLAQKAFGKSGADLLPFLDSFNGDLASLRKRAKELGVTIDDEAAKAADEFGDTLDTVSAQLAGAGRTIGIAFMPQFQKMAKETSEWAVRNKGEIKDWADGAVPAIEAVANAIKGLAMVVGETAQYMRANPMVAKFIVSQTVPAWFTALVNAGKGGTLFQPPPTARPDVENDPRNPFYKAATKQAPGNFWGYDPRATKGRRGGDDGDGGGGGGKKGSTGDNRTAQQVYEGVVRAFKERGVSITGLQGKRTTAQQAGLYAKYGPGGAARPGTSDHEFYGAVDLPANISQSILNAVSRQAGVSFDKPLFHGQGKGGYHRHQSFQKGKPSFGGGEADMEKTREDMEKLAAEATDLEREIESGFQDLAARMISEEQEASERRLDIRRAEAEIKISIIEDEVERGLVSERQGVEAIGQIKFDLLEKERDEIAKMVPTEERLHQLQMLDIALTKQAIENETAVNKILRDRVALYASMAVESDGDALVKSVEDAKAEQRRRQGERSAVTAPGSFGGSLADSLGADLVPMWDAATNAMIGFQDRMAMVQTDINDFVGGAIGGMVEGLAQMAIAWIVTGEGSAKAALQMMAATALSIAVQAGIKAVFEAAESVAAAARWDFVGAAAHATAATMYSSVAVIAGAAGIGLALGARAMGGGKGGGGGRGGGQDERNEPQFGRNLNKDPDPYTRRSENFFMSGRDNHIENLTRAIEGLNNKVDSMTPGDVLVRGAKQKSGFIGETAVKDFRTNNGLAVKGAKSMGIR